VIRKLRRTGPDQGHEEHATYGDGDPFVTAGLRKVLDRMELILHEESERATVKRLREQLDRP
jgi:hypothetical protein